MVDDVRDFRIVQQILERWHRARIDGAADVFTVQAIQDGIDLLGGVRVQHGGIALERRKRAGDTQSR